MPTWGWVLIGWPLAAVVVAGLWGWARRGQPRWADCVEDSEEARIAEAKD